MKIQGWFFALMVLCFNVLLFTSCKKINDATELGSDLIPPIDNITTFDTTLNVETYNALFTATEDSTTAGVLQYLGIINNDPLFGKSEGTMYFDAKPSLIRTPFSFSKDSIVALDSVVLVLGYTNTFGDSTKPVDVQVYEIPTTESFYPSQNYKIRTNPITTLGSPLSAVKTFLPQTLNDSIFPRGERTANQLRIPLNHSFGLRLLNYDSTSAYRSDSAFKSYFNGFAVVPQNNSVANALVGFNLSNSKLAFYVRTKNAGKIDTTTVSFTVNNTSALANYIKRNYAGSEIETALTGTTPDPLIYLQASPGSYAKVKIPGLGNLNNRVVHLAELIVEQVYDPLSPVFAPPPYLYLDAYDTAKSRYRTIPYDVLLNFQDGNAKRDSGSFSIANATNFGMAGFKKNDPLGNAITEWHFNLSRYVQHIVNKTEIAQELRLYAPFPVIRANSLGVEQYISTSAPYAFGRVRVGGGNHPTQKMRMRIVYSKL